MAEMYWRMTFWPLLTLVLACTAHRAYFIQSELPKLENDPDLAIAPGPWKAEGVDVVISGAETVPDELILPALKSLMELPGATDACDKNTGRPRPDAAEYCVAFYRTPQDWRVSSPIRTLMDEHSSCEPPFGGVDDQDFGRDLPIFGFAHNHPCGTNVSSPDLNVFPMARTDDGFWVIVAYSVTPGGRLARDSKGAPIPAWHWLATGHRGTPRFYKWNQAGELFRWNEGTRAWDFQAICKPQSSSMLSPKALSPNCSPAVSW